MPSSNTLVFCTDNNRHNYVDFIRKTYFNLTKTYILSKMKINN